MRTPAFTDPASPEAQDQLLSRATPLRYFDLSLSLLLHQDTPRHPGSLTDAARHSALVDPGLPHRVLHRLQPEQPSHAPLDTGGAALPLLPAEQWECEQPAAGEHCWLLHLTLLGRLRVRDLARRLAVEWRRGSCFQPYHVDDFPLDHAYSRDWRQRQRWVQFDPVATTAAGLAGDPHLPLRHLLQDQVHVAYLRWRRRPLVGPSLSRTGGLAYATQCYALLERLAAGCPSWRAILLNQHDWTDRQRATVESCLGRALRDQLGKELGLLLYGLANAAKSSIIAPLVHLFPRVDRFRLGRGETSMAGYHGTTRVVVLEEFDPAKVADRGNVLRLLEHDDIDVRRLWQNTRQTQATAPCLATTNIDVDRIDVSYRGALGARLLLVPVHYGVPQVDSRVKLVIQQHELPWVVLYCALSAALFPRYQYDTTQQFASGHLATHYPACHLPPLARDLSFAGFRDLPPEGINQPRHRHRSLYGRLYACTQEAWSEHTWDAPPLAPPEEPIDPLVTPPST